MRATALSVLLVVASFAEAAGGLDSVAGLRLPDQLGGEDSLAAHRGELVVVSVIDADRLRKLKRCEKILRETFDDLGFLRIGEVPVEPPVTLERVATKLAERVPEGVPVLIDMERRWAIELELDASKPNLLVIDRSGALVTTHAGRCSLESLAPVIAELETLVEGP
jgi:hypothetical protein